MARPIKETPVVTGKDAKRFAEKMAHLKPESKEEREAAKKVYEKFKAQYIHFDEKHRKNALVRFEIENLATTIYV